MQFKRYIGRGQIVLWKIRIDFSLIRIVSIIPVIKD